MMTVDKKQLTILKSFSKQVLAHAAMRERLKKEESQSRAAAIRPLLEEILNCYPKVQAELQADIKKSHINKRLYARTTFEIMSRHHLEATHSNVIGYLLSKPNAGIKLLQSMLAVLATDDSEFELLFDPNESFLVHREYSLSHKRIDLLLEGKSFVVGIENKYYSRLHGTDQGISQTAFYWQEIERRFRHKRRHYLILDYKGKEADEGYQTLSYEDLLNALEEVSSQFLKDQVYEEYVYLLRRTIYGLLNTVYENVPNLSISQLCAIRKGEH